MDRLLRINRSILITLLLLVVVTLNFTLFTFKEGGKKSPAQEYQPARIFTIQELQEDCEVLETTLMEAHGNLYAQIAPVDFKKTAQNIRKKLDRPMTEIEFFRVLSPLIAAIRCGHTHLLPSRDYETFLDREIRFLPYVLALIQKRLFVADEILPTKNSIRASEILSINSRSAQSVIDMILPNLSGDGAIQTQKQKKLAKNFSFYWNLYVGDAERFKLLIRTPNGLSDFIEPDTVSRTQYRKKESSRAPQKATPLAEFKLQSEFKTALLRMKTFYTVDLKQERIRYKTYFRDFFRQLKEKEIENLVIDIRGNAGGSIYLASELLAYLSDGKFRFLERYQLSSNLALTHKRHIERDPFISFKSLITNKKEGWRSFTWNRLLKLQKAKRRFHYNGKVCVLIDGETFSAASMFVSLVRRRKNTVFVGEESGGSACGNGVSPVHLTLPNTRLRAQIPFGYIKLAVSQDLDCDRGVIPDYFIEQTSDHILRDVDPALDFVLRMIIPGWSEK